MYSIIFRVSDSSYIRDWFRDPSLEKNLFNGQIKILDKFVPQCQHQFEYNICNRIDKKLGERFRQFLYQNGLESKDVRGYFFIYQNNFDLIYKDKLICGLKDFSI
jgi:hypothetical protein